MKRRIIMNSAKGLNIYISYEELVDLLKSQLNENDQELGVKSIKINPKKEQITFCLEKLN